MARRARVEYPGALYHVITRGNQRQMIFREDQDRDKYLVILASLKNQFSFRISAYVLMLNYVHLLLESGNVPLSRIMQRLGSGFVASPGGDLLRWAQSYGAVGYGARQDSRCGRDMCKSECGANGEPARD
jgi:hypothetical protein